MQPTHKISKKIYKLTRLLNNMALTLEGIILYLFFIDAIVANLMSWINPKWYKTNLRIFSRYFPPAKGWTAIYLIMVLWVGHTLYRMNVLF